MAYWFSSYRLEFLTLLCSIWSSSLKSRTREKDSRFYLFIFFSKIRYHFYLFAFELYVDLRNTYLIEYSLKNDIMLLSLSGVCVLSSSAYQRSKTQEHDSKTVLTPCLSWQAAVNQSRLPRVWNLQWATHFTAPGSVRACFLLLLHKGKVQSPCFLLFCCCFPPPPPRGSTPLYKP